MQREELLLLLASVGVVVDEITATEESTSLRKYGLDSLGVVQLLTAIENALGVTVPERFLHFSHFETIESLEHLIAILKDQ